MDAQYACLTFEIAEADAERLEAQLHAEGVSGLEIRDARTPPMPGVRAPKPGHALVLAYVERPETARQLRDALAPAFPSAEATLEEIPLQDWSVSWRDLVRSVEVGPFWVGPPWQAGSAPSGKHAIVIEPKMAFGTGDHPTTRLCLEAVADSGEAHPGGSVLDVGTGTGVLAIAARKLGASRVVATDNDPVAIELAREAASSNGVEVAFSLDPPERIDGAFDLVVANILANVLVELGPSIAPRVGGRLVLAGVLVDQVDEVAGVYEALGLRRVGTRTLGEWARIDLERPAR